jgi:DNA (cytosine-5)-methyltransferase 1
MITPQFLLPLHHELVIDLFAGGGGASTGIEQAIGRAVDIAINHDPEAVSLHQANHPQTAHYVSDVFEVEPLAVTQGRAVGMIWASPDCKHFSKAKGGKPVSKRVRGLAWVVVKWAKLVRPRVICLENVEEFQSWGPLLEDGRPCPERKGKTFARWVAQLRNLGYVVEHRELRACDYGAPTIRRRLFLVARCDGQPIVWPEATHGAPDSLPVKARKLKPWRTAAECIDWSITAPSIFERSRPLADATCRRIAKGIMRYVVDAAEPFIVPMRGTSPTHKSVHRVDAPLSTVTGGGTHHGLAVPTLISMGYGERPGQQPRVPGIETPHSTITAQGQHSALVTAFLAKHYTGVVGSDLADPMATVTSVDHHSLVAATMVTIDNQSSSGGSADIEAPLKTTTVENRHALVQAFMIKYYGSDQDPRLGEPMHTVTTRDRFGLVTVHGQPYAIVDIGLRMLTPRELYTAQGFPADYRIDQGADGRPLTKTAQVRMCGNSVCPPLARAVVSCNYSDTQMRRQAA